MKSVLLWKQREKINDTTKNKDKKIELQQGDFLSKCPVLFPFFSSGRHLHTQDK